MRRRTYCAILSIRTIFMRHLSTTNFVEAGDCFWKSDDVL
jgi:hypothetical protein